MAEADFASATVGISVSSVGQVWMERGWNRDDG